jgi:hypothetical protein
VERNWKKHKQCVGRTYDDRWYDTGQLALPTRLGIERYGDVFKVVSSDPTAIADSGSFDSWEAVAACFEIMNGLK